MRLIEVKAESAEENLAVDEALLAEGEEVLRFWETRNPVISSG